MTRYLIIFLYTYSLWSCSTGYDEISSFQEFNECHSRENLDSINITRTLIGIWELEQSFCAFDFNNEDCYGSTVEFGTDKKLTIRINETEIPKEFSWSLVNNEKAFWIETGSFGLKIDGVMLLCEDRVLFSNIFSDGCDNYFKKI